MISYQGAKARLRPLNLSDKPLIVQWHNDPGLRENVLGFRLPVSEVMNDRWFEAVMNPADRTRAVFAVETVGGGRMVGYVQLNQIDWISRTAFLGITIGDKAQWGTGLADEAVDLLLRFGSDALNLRKICLEVPGYNQRAIAFYKRKGFAVEGVRREQIYLEGQHHDLVLMAVFARDFLASRA